jgi:hypothetical protein
LIGELQNKLSGLFNETKINISFPEVISVISEFRQIIINENPVDRSRLPDKIQEAKEKIVPATKYRNDK